MTRADYASPMRRRASVLAALATLQGACAVFFAGDALADLRFAGVTAHTAFEALVTAALGIGTLVTFAVMRRTIEAARRANEALHLARGAFADVVEARFSAWGLTPSEAEVALFTLKGLDAAEVAEVRGSAPGTVRAQLAAVYRKSGASNRSQFVALFLDELMEGLPRSDGAA
ncbi:helix-turn-helix transcriptional regulator [Roseibacterium sp. SDUM158017]|uniref:helix-turn-helix transcriptional regulator n=1 Tax=Roseicyclus salinarum TaxID=3036773 RepID=UPI0024157803|nr:helix-turn-helix transcriptional regulator [Roseibacterium sp. SDUM158017]MDG4650455.1 helix-turn-helix transcriptional regulator [Roseibacterium sp. SDUM158017]